MTALDETSAPTTRVVHTACTLDCPDACSLAVTITDGPSGSRITDIDASPVSSFTDGWICAKVKRHAERVYAPERVLTPLIRTGRKGAGEFRSATWDEVLPLIAGRMQSAVASKGADAVVAFTYNSSAAVVERASFTEAFFAAIGATIAEHTICAHTMGLAWESVYGEMNSADARDVVHSKLVVIWGANPTVSNTHFPPLVQQAVKAGAKVVVIDPRRTAMAKRADLHLALLPGTDTALALAIANLWAADGRLGREFIAAHADGADEFLTAAAEWPVERAAAATGLEEADIVTLADWWGTTRPSMLRIGWGQERNANGGAACRAILALPVLAGHFGEPGSGVIGSVSAGAAKPRRRWPQAALDAPARRSLPLHQVGQWMAPGSADACEVLFVQGANPLVMCPDQRAVVAAFERDDVFTVVHEQVLTDTTRYADVVLPATTSFEIADVTSGYGSLMVMPVEPAIPRVGESRSNDETGLALAQAYGFDWSDVPLATAAPDPGPREAVVPSRQFVDTAPAGDRARLLDPVQGVPRHLDAVAPAGSLTLISPATSKLINSMFGEFQSPSPAVLVHPDDAADRGLVTGQQVRVASQVATITVPLAVSADTRRGVAVMSKGVWLREHADGWGVNALTPATGDALGNGACFNDTYVTITAAG
ncbi:MAG: molybdopterin-dependent oxidoreductase [Ilumatobacteraceae bacterium]